MLRALYILTLIPVMSGVTSLETHASELALVDSLYSEAERAYLSGDLRSAASAYAATVDQIDEIGEDGRAYLEERRRRARFLLARSLEGSERWTEAREAYETALRDLPILSDAINLRIARCHQEEGELRSAIERLRVVIDAPERTTLYLTAVEQLADAHREAEEYDVAIQWYRVLLKELFGYDAEARIRYKIGAALEERGDADAAAQAFAEIVIDFPRSRHACDALDAGRRISRAFTDRYHQGLVLYNRRRFREAEDFFQYYLRHNSEGEFRSQASYFKGRSHQRMGSYGSAAGEYEDVIEYGPDAEYFDLAWAKLAYCRRATGRLDESLRLYEEYASLYPDRDAAPDMLWERGRLLEEKLRWEEAVEAYRELGRRYAASDKGRDGLFRAALCLYKLGRFQEAEAAFTDLPVGEDGELAARALFWAGKSREALGESDAATARYQEAVTISPDSYYGRRALYRIRQADSFPPARDDVPSAEQAAASETWRTSGARAQLGLPFRRVSGLQDFAAWLAEWYHLVYLPGERVELARILRSEPAFQRADAFMALHMTEEAGKELFLLEDLYGSDPRMLDILIGYYEGNGLHKRAIRLAEWILELSPAERLSEAPPYLRRKICPQHFDEIVKAECLSRGLEPTLFYSLIRQESLFEPRAISWVGARGLSQIMPSTGVWIARRLDVRGFRTHDLLNPETNIQFGTYYLAEQVEDFDGDVMRALAAYNGGPHNVDRWWNYGGGRDTDVFVEDIGYAQTNEYVRLVFLYGEFYRELDGKG